MERGRGGIAATYGHPGLISSCATCCAEVFTASGDWVAAERQLREALVAVGSTGHRARCIGPAAKLADLLVDQGRFEEARTIVAADDGGPALLVRARLALATGDPSGAVVLLERHCRRLGGDTLLTAPAAALLVDAHLVAHQPRAGGAAPGGTGLTNAELAEWLSISVKTAGNHVSNILGKLGLRSRVEAAAYAALHPDRPGRSDPTWRGLPVLGSRRARRLLPEPGRTSWPVQGDTSHGRHDTCTRRDDLL